MSFEPYLRQTATTMRARERGLARAADVSRQSLRRAEDALGQANAQLVACQERFAELDAYRKEYARRLLAEAQDGLASDRLRQLAAFLDSLNRSGETLLEQAERIEGEIAAHRTAVNLCAARARGLERALEQWNTRLEYTERRREGRELEELATQSRLRVLRGGGSGPSR